jgi:hypothetical protein
MKHGKYGERRKIPEEINGNTNLLAIPRIYQGDLFLAYKLP